MSHGKKKNPNKVKVEGVTDTNNRFMQLPEGIWNNNMKKLTYKPFYT